MSDTPATWSEQVTTDLDALPTLTPAESVEVFARMHATLQTALAGTADAGAGPRPPGH